jgi:hypothetical protein
MRLVQGDTVEVLTHVRNTASFEDILRARLHDPSLLTEQIDSLQTVFYHPDGRLKIVDSNVDSWKVLLRIAQPTEDGIWHIPPLAYDRVPARFEAHRDALDGLVGKHLTTAYEISNHILLRALVPDSALREEFAHQTLEQKGIEPFGVYISREQPYAFFRKISVGNAEHTSALFLYNGCYQLTVLER